MFCQKHLKATLIKVLISHSTLQQFLDLLICFKLLNNIEYLMKSRCKILQIILDMELLQIIKKELLSHHFVFLKILIIINIKNCFLIFRCSLLAERSKITQVFIHLQKYDIRRNDVHNRREIRKNGNTFL